MLPVFIWPSSAHTTVIWGLPHLQGGELLIQVQTEGPTPHPQMQNLNPPT